jgi:small ligand-binding sensory domain FIST
MQWVSALSTCPSLEGAIAEVTERIKATLAGEAHFGLLFLSGMFASEYPRLPPLLKQSLPIQQLIGCGGGGIIGMPNPASIREVEHEPALVLMVAHLPGVDVHTFHLAAEELPDLDSPPQAWIERVGVAVELQPHFLLLPDPFTADINDLIQGLDFAYPTSVKVGGLASGVQRSDRPQLFFQDGLVTGTVGVAFSGAIDFKAIVAQGCRPIGPIFQVEEGERNILVQLEDDQGNTRSALEALQEVLQRLDESDRELAQHALFVGMARSAFQQTLESGDFLIRNLLGVDPRTGAIAIGDRVRSGQRIQFHLRDSRASGEDLEFLLKRHCASHPQPAVAGFMFACLGRGEGLYGQPDYDSQLFQHFLPEVPLAGFFCNGEIGPIAGTTFLHGYTSVFGIMYAK